MKYVISLIVVFILTNCEIGIQKSKAIKDTNIEFNYVYMYKEEVRHGMKFGIWFVESNHYSTGYSTSVINLTKDSLEIEYYKKQLKLIE